MQIKMKINQLILMIETMMCYINFHEKDLIKCDEIQKLIVNNLFLNTCRLYFKTGQSLLILG